MLLFIKFYILIFLAATIFELQALENSTVVTNVEFNVTVSTQNFSSTSDSLDDNDDEIYYVCEKPYKFDEEICHCHANRVLICDSFSETLKSANIKIKNETFVLKKAQLRLELKVLKKDKLLPGAEKTVEEMDFSFAKIDRIEDGVFDKFENLSKLSLKYCGIDKIDDGVLTESVGSRLKSLNLEHNFLNFLAPNTFKNLRKLTSLYLKSNNFSTSLSKKLFSSNLETLKELRLDDCNISTLEDDVFVHLSNLDSLGLEGNPLTSIPKAINLLPNLNYLDMDHTQITVLADTAINKNLKKIEMRSSSHLNFIDECAFCGFQNLEELDISENYALAKIHENAFGAFVGKNISKLSKFYANNCHLKVLPEKLLNWTSVKEIRIDENEFVCNCSMAWLINDFVNPNPKYYKNVHGHALTCHSPSKYQGHSFQDISGTICSDTNDVIDNRITVCEYWSEKNSCECNWVGALTCKSSTINPKSITSLNLKIKDKNFVLKKVSFLHIPLHALKKGKIVPGREHTVEAIELQNNKISHIDDGVFDSFVLLKTLKVKMQQLNSLNNSFLTEQIGSTLIELDLEEGEFQTISLATFKHFKKLEILSLSFNSEISKNFTKELFTENLKTLKSLDLSVCGIHSLEEDVFENLGNLEKLKLILNPLTSIPTAINNLPNLRNLDLAVTNIVHLNNDGIEILPKLEKIIMTNMKLLLTIEDCAFCSFPNLESLIVAGSYRLERIHVNAFGAANGTFKPKLKYFNANACNITVFQENLLNWDTIDEMIINYNPFICNCSMAWLINDFAYSTPKYENKLKLHKLYGPNDTITCKGPPELKDKTFQEISNKLCNTSFTQNAVFERFVEPSHFSWFLPLIIILIVISIFNLGLISIILYHRKTKSLEKVLSEDKAEKLNEEVPLNNL